MDICKTKDNIENKDCNKYALDFELLLALDGLDVQYELICPESLKPSSDSQCLDQDQFLEDFCNLSTDTVLPSTKKEEINDLKNTASQFTEDKSAMRGKEGKNVQKRKYIDLSFLDELDIEEPPVKRPAFDNSLKRSSDSQCLVLDQFLEDFCNLSMDTVLPSTKKEEINDLKNTASQFTEDKSAMRGKEGKNVQKRKYIDLSFLDELDIEEPPVKRPAFDNSLKRSSDSQCLVLDQFLEDFSNLSMDTVLPSTKKEEINDLKNISFQFTEDKSAMRGKEGKIVQKQKYIDLSFLDELDIEEPPVKLPAFDDTETVNPSATLKVQIISKKSRKVEPSLLVQLLKGLTSKKAKEYWMNNCKEYFNNGRGLCCNNNCCMAWKYVDIKTILSTWL